MDLFNKITAYKYLDEAIIIFLGLFAVLRWNWQIVQIVGLIMAIVYGMLWFRFRKMPETSYPLDTPVYAKLKTPKHMYFLLFTLGLVIAANYFSFFLLFAILVMLRMDRLSGRERLPEKHHH